MTSSQIIEVVQAFMDGKQIQIRERGRLKWTDRDYPRWNFEACEYRVKPEPLVIWMLKRDGKLIGGYYKDRNAALASTGYEFGGCDVVKMVETPEDD
jgi:hypothetical protein